jgi:hypothetical protein
VVSTTEWAGRRTGGDVEIVVPVYNERADLALGITRLRAYLDDRFPFTAMVTIVDNASTDGTDALARALAAELPDVRVVRLEQKGRGRAIRSVWGSSDAAVVAYMDVDLSTDLDALLPLVAPLVSGHSDVAIGSRLATGAHVVRGPKRELLSRGYNLLLRALLRNRFTDAQCGFKAMRSDVARRLLPQVQDDAWFFDTELLVLAERAGLRIHEVPVDWVDDPDSRVDIARTVAEDLKGVWRLWRHPSAVDPAGWRAGELGRTAGVGAFSTAALVLLFLLLRPTFGPFAANALALGLCALANLAVHRRLAPAGGRPAPTAALVATAAAVGANLVISTVLLAAAVWLAPGSVPAMVAALLTASALVAGGRVVMWRAPAFRRYRQHTDTHNREGLPHDHRP